MPALSELIWSAFDADAKLLMCRSSAVRRESHAGRRRADSYEGQLSIYAKTWGQVIEENRARLKFFQDALEVQADREASLKYLQERYAVYLEGVFETGEADAEIEAGNEVETDAEAPRRPESSPRVARFSLSVGGVEHSVDRKLFEVVPQAMVALLDTCALARRRGPPRRSDPSCRPATRRTRTRSPTIRGEAPIDRCAVLLVPTLGRRTYISIASAKRWRQYSSWSSHITLCDHF
ncbi:hypothetical protein [Cupriavidus oxalaticus]|uniref:hypothetical protein n=1 Tax=Cupriavidus oxalaticus TaxID=96344 RepID=UPI001247C831|nr:hypothetical protein [Cupriavidus oxalaticus]